MHILFADESGTPPKPNDSRAKYFVVGGIIVPEAIWHRLRDAILGMKVRRRIRGEFKWRYFAPGNSDPANPMRHLDQYVRNEIRAELYKIICAERSVRTLAAVCSATAAYRLPSITNQEGIYHLTYKTLTERFQYHLQDLTQLAGQTERGLIIADHRGSGEDKRLRQHHQKLLYSSGQHISDYANLIESLLLQPSNLSIGIQLADMVAGAVWRKFERSDDTWYSLLESSLRRSKGGTIPGYGIIKAPKAGWV